MTALADSLAVAVECFVRKGAAALEELPAWRQLQRDLGAASPSWRHEWLAILRDGLGHEPYCLEARRGGETVGLLRLCFVKSALFGKFLVSMPYLNVGGVLAKDEQASSELITRAARLADELDVRYLELRHETPAAHPVFTAELRQKVHMRLALPPEEETLWKGFDPKTRNQVRKGEKNDLTVHWGGASLLDEFYRVFSVNMRDLGTPVYSRKIFAAILTHLGGDAEICVVRTGANPIAAGLLVYGDGVVEVPSASSLRRYNSLNANMLMYWRLLRRGVERGCQTFDFGRSSAGSSTYKFKAQWGAQPHPAVWQYSVRRGSLGDMRPDDPKQERRIAVWRRLPVWLTRLAGPSIVRGIP